MTDRQIVNWTQIPDDWQPMPKLTGKVAKFADVLADIKVIDGVKHWRVKQNAAQPAAKETTSAE